MAGIEASKQPIHSAPIDISQQIERLLTQVRTTYGYHEAQLDNLPTHMRVTPHLTHLFFVSPNLPRFLYLGPVQQLVDSDDRGLAIALPMKTRHTTSLAYFHGFAMFSVYPDAARHIEGSDGIPKAHVFFHEYTPMQNIETFKLQVGQTQRPRNVPLVPGDFVSLNDVFDEVQRGVEGKPIQTFSDFLFFSTFGNPLGTLTRPLQRIAEKK